MSQAGYDCCMRPEDEPVLSRHCEAGLHEFCETLLGCDCFCHGPVVIGG